MAKVRTPAVTAETIRRVNAKLVARKKIGSVAPQTVYFLGYPIHIGMKFDASAWNKAWKKINERHARKAV